MKQFLDFLPLVVFFAFYKLYDIYAATTALIVATAVVLIYSWVRYRKVEKMALITFVLVAVFGGLTIFFHNDEFIKWKVTVIYALFAGALLFSQWVMKKPLIQRMLGKELSLPQQVWSRLNLAWAVFFILCGLANTRRDINIRTLFVILHHIARFVEKGHSDAGCRLISCLVFKIIAVRGIGNTAKSDAGDTVATFFRGRAIS